MNIKALALGTVIGFMVALAPSCGGAKCGPANCAGCCDAKGQCVKEPANSNNTTCGRAGNVCADCSALGQACSATSFTCAPIGGTGGGGGGGGTGGGGGGGASCDGCRLPSGTCVPLNSTTPTNCGSMGNACTTCQSGQLCTAGACTTPDAGFGRIGDPCTTDNDCSNIALNATEMSQGIKPFCKKTAVPGGYTYENGYCTKRCLGSTNCGTSSGTANVCVYYLGVLGEVENICLKGCQATGSCGRSGYECINFGSSTTPAPACWVIWPDGGLPDEVDAGPGYTGAAGGPCTGDMDCGPAGYAFCLPETEDGGATGFTGGQCSADCSLTTDDNWCGDAGVCLPYGFQSSDGFGPVVGWLCGQECTPPGASTCRSGYVCDPFGTSGIGTCTPNCNNNPTALCGSAGCNTTTGLCN